MRVAKMIAFEHRFSGILSNRKDSSFSEFDAYLSEGLKNCAYTYLKFWFRFSESKFHPLWKASDTVLQDFFEFMCLIAMKPLLNRAF